MASSSQRYLAVCQYAPRVGDLAWNLEEGGRQLERAADLGAELVVLPELASSGYTFGSQAEAEASSRELGSSEALSRWLEVCRRRSVFAVAGFAERGGSGLYNSAVLLGPEGVLGVYRKAHLFNDEKSWFQPGDVGFPVFATPLGRVGILICYDLWFPEAGRLLGLAGAEVVCVPTNWVANFRDRAVDERGWTMGNYACVGVATQNQVVVAAADRTGSERGVDFVGCSCVVGSSGQMLAGPAPVAEDAVLLAAFDSGRIRASRARTPRNDTFADRRPELYRALSVSTPPSSL